MSLRRIRAWLEDRTGAGSALDELLSKRIPPRLPWSYTLGSLLLMLAAIQAITGIFLAVYYAPTPDHAHDSVRYIDTAVTGGRLLRGLHHWGATFMVVALGLHMLRAFLHASYRKPREMTWILGVKLLFVVLAFGLTGYLLPWDQKAYWATMVTLRIAESVPLVGPALAAIGAGGERLGALTLTRFYAIHILMLPALLLLVVGGHLWLVRRHSSAGPPSYKGDPERDGVPFHPTQSARDGLAMVVVFGALLITAALKGAPLDPVADPTDSSYVPRPEWYFLGLFQLLKYFPGPYEAIGTVVIPGIVAALLLALPFLDRGESRAVGARRGIVAGGLALLAGVVALTALGALDRGGTLEPAWAASGRTPFHAVAGPLVIQKRDCGSCHQPDGFGIGPPFGSGSLAHDATWVRAHMSDPEYVAPGARDPEQRVPGAEASVVLAWLALLKSGTAPAVVSTSERSHVALVFREGCIGCHRIDGAGGTMGPSLAGVGKRHDKAWIINYLPNPEAVNPEAKMRSYPELTPAELDSIATYVMRL